MIFFLSYFLLAISLEFNGIHGLGSLHLCVCLEATLKLLLGVNSDESTFTGTEPDPNFQFNDSVPAKPEPNNENPTSSPAEPNLGFNRNFGRI